MKVFYFRSILKCAIYTGILIWCIYKIVSRTPLMAVSSFKGDFKVWYEQHLKVVDAIFKVMIMLAFSYCFFSFAVPFYMDVPDIISGNYQYIEGTVMTNAYSSRDSERLVKVKEDGTGNIVSVSIFYDKANEGDYIKVKYLKHSKQGIVVNHVKK